MNNTQSPIRPRSLGKLLSNVQEQLAIATKRDNNEVWTIYKRISRKPRGKYSYSLDIQEDRAEEHARQHHAGEIIVYEDPYLSGKNSKRKDLSRLIRDIKAGKVDVLVLHRFSRLYRNLESFLGFIRLLQKYNVRLISVTEDIDTNQWWGRLLIIILGALAEMYVWQASDRTREAKRDRAEKGLQNGRIPIGYCDGLCATCKDPNGVGYCQNVGAPDRQESERGRIAVPHPVDSHLVRLVTHLYSQGWSYREIANHINSHTFRLPNGQEVRFRTKGTSGRKTDRTFNAESIRQIVGNPFYTGMVARYPRAPFNMEDNIEHPERIKAPRPDGNPREPEQLYQGLHEALISKHLWEKNTKLRKAKSHTPGNTSRPRRIYPLTSVGRCWECYEAEGRKSTLRGSTGRGTTRYYRCAYLQDRGSKPVIKRIEGKNSASNLEITLTDNRLQELRASHKTLRSDKLEPQIDNLMSQFSIPQEWHELIMAYYLSDEGMTEFEYEGHNLRQSLARFRKLYLGKHISQAEFDAQALHLTRQIEELKPSANPEAREILPLMKDFASIWKKLTDSEKRGLLDVIFEGLYFDHDAKLRRISAHTPFDYLLGLPEGGIVYA